VHWLALDVQSEASLEAAVKAAAPGEVYHLAAQSSVGSSFDDPIGTWDVNAMGTLRLLDVLGRCISGRARVLLVSSAEVYGAVPEAEQPLSETRPLGPVSPYASSKAAAEMAALQAGAGGQLSVVIARSFNHTGPGQDVRFALPGFARQLREVRAGRRDAVLRVGNLDVWRDFLDVRDVAGAYLRLAEQGMNRLAYNVCSGEALRLGTLVERLVELSGTGARVEVDAERLRPVEIPLLRGDSTRLRALGWKPRISMDQTLRDLLATEVPE
jgi:GDP-4-dehydro-6-deoxy-D-mannose reductase